MAAREVCPVAQDMGVESSLMFLTILTEKVLQISLD